MIAAPEATGKWDAWLSASRSWLVTYVSNRELQKEMKKHFRGRLIDIGCGDKPLQTRTRNWVQRHVGIDHPASLHALDGVDALATAYQIPFRDQAFDCALCTVVLEHLEEPEAALRECFRVLKPGSAALYTVPFIWHVHEAPRDFYRFSKYGLDYLFTKAGFRDLEIRAMSGFWLTFGQLLVYNLHRFNRGPLRYIPVIPALGFLLQFLFLFLDKLDRTERWTWAYLIVAHKPYTN